MKHLKAYNELNSSKLYTRINIRVWKTMDSIVEFSDNEIKTIKDCVEKFGFEVDSQDTEFIHIIRDNRNIIDIIKDSDDYYFCKLNVRGCYKCDGLDGLMQFLADNNTQSIMENLESRLYKEVSIDEYEDFIECLID